MSRDNLRAIGVVLIVVLIVALIIFWSDIKTAIDTVMVRQADSLVDQLLR